MKKIAIRTDGNQKLGMGNIFRSLALAEKIKDGSPDVKICFITRNYPDAINEIRKREFPIYLLPVNNSDHLNTDIVISSLKEFKSSIIINDIKDTEIDYIRKLKENNITVINFDDLGHGRELADYLFDAFLFNKLPRPNKNDFFGPDYLVLREEFLRHKNKRIHKGEVAKLTLLLGGSNSGNLLPIVLEALSLLPQTLECNIILGKAVNHAELFQLEFDRKNFNFYYNPDNLPLLLADSDLAITAGGISMCEALSLGTPVIVIPQVPHEVSNAAFFANQRALYALPYTETPSSEEIYKEIRKIILNRKLLKKMSSNGPQIIDGKGLERVVNAIKPALNNSYSQIHE